MGYYFKRNNTGVPRLFPKNNPTLDEASNDHQKFLADLRGLLWAESMSRSRSWKDVAVKACVGESTVQRFADGKTVRPTSFTVTQVAKSIGFRIALVPDDVPKSPGEIG